MVIEVAVGLGQLVRKKLVAAPDFTPLHVPECNIDVFRHLPESLKDASETQRRDFELGLRRRVIESGEFSLVSTKIDGVGALRTTLIHPKTTGEQLDQLLVSLRRHGRHLLDEATSGCRRLPSVRRA